MKYIWKATRQRGVFGNMVLYIIISTISVWLNAKVLIWIQQALENYKDPVKWLVLTITEIMIVTIFDGYLNYTSAFTARIFTNLIDLYTDKLAKSDYELYTKYNPGELSTIVTNCKQMSKIPWFILTIIMNIAKVIINITMVLMANAKIGSVVLVIYFAGAFIIRMPIKKYIDLDNKFDKLKHKRNKEVDELINGFSEVRSFAGLQKHQANIIK